MFNMSSLKNTFDIVFLEDIIKGKVNSGYAHFIDEKYYFVAIDDFRGARIIMHVVSPEQLKGSNLQQVWFVIYDDVIILFNHASELYEDNINFLVDDSWEDDINNNLYGIKDFEHIYKNVEDFKLVLSNKFETLYVEKIEKELKDYYDGDFTKDKLYNKIYREAFNYMKLYNFYPRKYVILKKDVEDADINLRKFDAIDYILMFKNDSKLKSFVDYVFQMGIIDDKLLLENFYYNYILEKEKTGLIFSIRRAYEIFDIFTSDYYYDVKTVIVEQEQSNKEIRCKAEILRYNDAPYLETAVGKDRIYLDNVDKISYNGKTLFSNALIESKIEEEEELFLDK